MRISNQKDDDENLQIIPLLHMLGFIKKHGPLNEKQTPYLNQIESAGYKLLEMINRTSDLIQMERGTYQFEFVQVEVLFIIKEVLGEFADRTKKQQNYRQDSNQ